MKGLGLALCAFLSACVGTGDVPAQLSGAIVDENEMPIGPGLVLIEKGKVHEGSYETGALIGENGRFTAELREGGTWGIHLFYNEHYSYVPLEITIEEHEQVVLNSTQVAWGLWLEKTGQPTWPDQPEDAALVLMPPDDNLADNPIIEELTLAYRGEELLDITIDVFDPTGDLSRMILGYDPTTHTGFSLRPPGPPDDRGRYPNGIYTYTMVLDEDHIPGESVMYFIVSDNPCNNTPIQIVPLPAR